MGGCVGARVRVCVWGGGTPHTCPTRRLGEPQLALLRHRRRLVIAQAYKPNKTPNELPPPPPRQCAGVQTKQDTKRTVLTSFQTRTHTPLWATQRSQSSKSINQIKPTTPLCAYGTCAAAASSNAPISRHTIASLRSVGSSAPGSPRDPVSAVYIFAICICLHTQKRIDIPPPPPPPRAASASPRAAARTTVARPLAGPSRPPPRPRTHIHIHIHIRIHTYTYTWTHAHPQNHSPPRPIAARPQTCPRFSVIGGAAVPPQPRATSRSCARQQAGHRNTQRPARLSQLQPLSGRQLLQKVHKTSRRRERGRERGGKRRKEEKDEERGGKRRKSISGAAAVLPT